MLANPIWSRYFLRYAALCLVTIPVFSMSEAAAQENSFKSADFLKWKRASQEFYIRTSIGMAGLIAARNDKAHGDCLESWYFSDEKAANTEIIDVMRTYPDYHPRGVIVSVMEKRCGPIVYSKR